MTKGARGAALVEFALAWPVVLLLVLTCVEMAVWSAEAQAARAAALAGARAATPAAAQPELASAITVRVLDASLVGVVAAPWCPGSSGSIPQVWVCARERGGAIEVIVGGAVPALVPMIGAVGLPLRADAVLPKEAFVP